METYHLVSVNGWVNPFEVVVANAGTKENAIAWIQKIFLSSLGGTATAKAISLDEVKPDHFFVELDDAGFVKAADKFKYWGVDYCDRPDNEN